MFVNCSSKINGVLRIVLYMKENMLEKVLNYLSGKASISLDENGQIKYRITKTLKKKPVSKRVNGNNSKSKKVSVNTNNASPLKKKSGGDHLLESYEAAFNQIMRDVLENSSPRHLDNVLHTNSSKIIGIFRSNRGRVMLLPFKWV